MNSFLPLPVVRWTLHSRRSTEQRAVPEPSPGQGMTRSTDFLAGLKAVDVAGRAIVEVTDIGARALALAFAVTLRRHVVL